MPPKSLDSDSAQIRKEPMCDDAKALLINARISLLLERGRFAITCGIMVGSPEKKIVYFIFCFFVFPRMFNVIKTVQYFRFTLRPPGFTSFMILLYISVRMCTTKTTGNPDCTMLRLTVSVFRSTGFRLYRYQHLSVSKRDVFIKL